MATTAGVNPCPAASQHLFCQAVFQQLLPPSPGFTLPSAELHELSVSPLLRPVQVPLCGSTTPCRVSRSARLCLTCKRAEGPSPTSVMKMLNSTGPSVSPWGAPVLTGPQLDAVPLLTAPQALPPSQLVKLDFPFVNRC